MTEPVLLDASTIVPQKAFTDPEHVYYDHVVLESMLLKVCLMLERLSPPEVITGFCDNSYPEPDKRYHRVILVRPERLMAHPCPAVVGFIGTRRPNSDLEMMMVVGQQLIDEFRNFDPILSYSTMSTVGGNFANLVILDHAEAIATWRMGQLHREVAGEPSANYYRHVRIYNGHWGREAPLGQHIQLHHVKYFDFGQKPVWRAIRELADGR